MKQMLFLALIMEIGFSWVAFGQTNLITVSELDSAASDWPNSVVATTNISVGTNPVIVIPEGEVLRVLSASNTLISTVYQENTNQIPASATDIVEQINELRRHRLIIGKEQYDNYRIVPCNPAEVKIFHRTGIAVIPIAELPAELQKQLGYDKDKATEFLTKRREDEQLRREEQARQRRAEQDFAYPIGVGSTGVLKKPVHLIQIAGPDEMLAEIEVALKAVDPVTGVHYYRYNEKPPVLFYIRGLSTDGLVDDQYFNTTGLFKITGTRRYATTMGGTKTVFVLEPTTE